MITSIIPPPMRLLLCSNPVRLTLEVDDVTGELHVLHWGTRIGYRQCLEIFLEDEVPVTVKLLDFKDGEGRCWTVDATTNVPRFDGTNEVVPWQRGQQVCHATWWPTEEAREICVTASHAGPQKLDKSQIFFVRVRPDGAKPWP